jgi:glucose/arabinose dehydrogenase
MRRPAFRTACVAASAVLLVAACSGSDSNETSPTDGPDVTLGTVPEPAATVAPEPPTTSGEGEGEVTTPASTTIPIIPSPDADLPTQAPSQVEAVPVTTLPGPLPEPSVRLIDIATFDEPVEATGAPGDQRVFVVQKAGVIIAVDDESNLVVFDISAVAATTFTSEGGEQGLLGLAFHPTEPLAYVNFSTADGNTMVGEFVVDPFTYDFDPTSFREVIQIAQPFGNHNGGELAFGPDDMLYIGLGDGGSADDPNRAALDLSSRLGKILRIDPLASEVEPFTVPADNPFVGVDGADPTIWSLGLRNPWRFSFDSLTGDLWIADVGQNTLEEIDVAAAVDGLDAGRGVSFGWSAFEATDRFNEDQPADGHTLPVVTYTREGGNCSVSGGVVARDSSYHDLNGWYIYGDYCSGIIWALDTTSVTSTPTGPAGEPRIIQIATLPALTAIVEGPLGDIYALSLEGSMQRLVPA